jgi:hypothetical protein
MQLSVSLVVIAYLRCRSCQSGAPRSMKMGTIRSLCPYDAVARDAFQPVKPRRAAILHYASGYRSGPVTDRGHAEQFPEPKSGTLDRCKETHLRHRFRPNQPSDAGSGRPCALADGQLAVWRF